MKKLPFVVVITVSLLTTACGAPATIQSTATPITLPPTHETTPTPMPPIAMPIPATSTHETVPSSTVRIVGHENPASSRLELWLEFAFEPGDTLLGSQIETYLNNGSLELTFPIGEKKTFEQVPHSPTDSEIKSDVWLPEGTGIRTSPPPAGALPLNGFLFENYSNAPIGPQVRIPLDKISDISVIGEYQITWKSGDLISNTLTFEWDGEKIIVHASTETPIPPTACIGSSGSWSTPPNGELSIIFTIQDCKITTVFIMGLINGQWLTMSDEVNEPIHSSEFNFLRNLSDQDRYSLNGTFSSPTSVSIQLVLFKGLRFTTDQPSPLNEDLIINTTATLGQ